MIKKKLLLIHFIVIPVFILTSFFLAFFYFNRKLKPINSEIQSYKQKLTKYKSLVIKKNQQLLQNKAELTCKNNLSATYFSYTQNKTTDEISLKISYEGNPDTLTDAVDLVLKYNSKYLDVKRINSGTAFPLYPRKTIKNKEIVISGAAKLASPQLIYGKTNELFAEIIFKLKEPRSTKPIKIILDELRTKAYFNGISILNYEKTFEIISI